MAERCRARRFVALAQVWSRGPERRGLASLRSPTLNSCLVPDNRKAPSKNPAPSTKPLWQKTTPVEAAPEACSLADDPPCELVPNGSLPDGESKRHRNQHRQPTEHADRVRPPPSEQIAHERCDEKQHQHARHAWCWVPNDPWPSADRRRKQCRHREQHEPAMCFRSAAEVDRTPEERGKQQHIDDDDEHEHERIAPTRPPATRQPDRHWWRAHDHDCRDHYPRNPKPPVSAHVMRRNERSLDEEQHHPTREQESVRNDDRAHRRHCLRQPSIGRRESNDQHTNSSHCHPNAEPPWKALGRHRACAVSRLRNGRG